MMILFGSMFGLILVGLKLCSGLNHATPRMKATVGLTMGRNR